MFQTLKKGLINSLSGALSMEEFVNLWYHKLTKVNLSPKFIYAKESREAENNGIKFEKQKLAIA